MIYLRINEKFLKKEELAAEPEDSDDVNDIANAIDLS